MTRKVNLDNDDISTSLRIVLQEELNNESTDDSESEDEQQPSPTDRPSRGDSQDSPLLEGIGVDTRERPVDEGISDRKALRETLVFGQEDDITTSSSFRPTTDNGEDIFPLRGSGQIDSMFISSASNTFKVFLELDGDKILDSISWSDLESQSDELAHIGAYQKSSGDFVVSINDYPFNQEIDFSIKPAQQTSFNTIRVEIMLDEYGTGE